MKAVILAAGYGTRLQRDAEADTTGRYAHLVGVAKPLLPVGCRALISHWVRALTASGCVDSIFVITNALYNSAFEEWASNLTNVKILSDQTTSNEGRLGAVACLQLAVKHFNIDDHILVIGGDTLFREDFSLTAVKQRFSELQAKCEDSCLLLSYRCKDEETQKYGILEVDGDHRVLCMKEKPHPSETTSRRACPCFYVLSKKSLPLLDTFMEDKKVTFRFEMCKGVNGVLEVIVALTTLQEAPIEARDAPGNFVSWLIHRKPVYVHEISGRFDVGNLPSYIECDLYFREKLQNADSYMI